LDQENPKPERILAPQASRQQTSGKGRTYSRPPCPLFGRPALLPSIPARIADVLIQPSETETDPDL
jgi:hypothetical protein